MRSEEHPYGLPGLSVKDQQKVSEGNYHSAATARMAKDAYHAGVAGMAEPPEPMGDHVSMFDLEEWQEFLRLPRVRVVKFDHCPMGAETRSQPW